MFQNTVEEGRFVFRLNPSQIFTSSGQPVWNSVAIHSQHMNPGYYATHSEYQLIVRTAWNEQSAFAANEQEARRSVASEPVNHDQPDLGLFANVTNLPVEMPKPGRMDVPVMIANLGEATSSPTRLLMLGGEDSVLATAPIPALRPGAGKTITVPFDYDGKLMQLSFRFENNHDFDSSNDSLTLILWGPKPTGYDGPEPGLPKVPVELTVKLFNEDTSPSSYRIVSAFSRRMISKVVNGEQFGPVSSGTYRVAAQQFPDEGQEVLFTDNIQHQAGVPQTIQLNSGIKFEGAGSIWQWSAVEAGNSSRTIQWQSGQHPLMALPPGEYQVAMQPIQFDSQRVVWPQKVRVEPGQQVTFKLDSGVRLEMPQGIGPLWLWQVVRYGTPDQVVQWQYGDQRTMTVPPGEYQVAMQPIQFDSQRVVWPQKVRVEPGQQVTFKLDSGVRMVGPPGASPDFEFQFLNDKKQTVQWGRQTWNTQALPPGTYSLQIRRQFGEWKTVAEHMQVREGVIVDVHISELPR